MSNRVDHILGIVNVLQVDIGLGDPFLAWIQDFNKRAPIWAKDHGEAATGLCHERISVSQAR